MSIQAKTGICMGCGKSRPLTAGRCSSCYWPYRRSLKEPKGQEPAKKSHIPARSEKKIARDIRYAKIRKSWLPAHPECEAKLPGCKYEATQVHHKEGREGDLLFDTEKWLALCWHCHDRINEHSDEAIELGLSLRRNGPIRK